VLSLALPVDIYLCVQRTDMRKSFNGLWALAVEHLGRDPLATAVAKYTQTAPELADWMEGNVSESLTVFCLPARHRVRMRTSNMLERLNREITRRTRVVSVARGLGRYHSSGLAEPGRRMADRGEGGRSWARRRLLAAVVLGDYGGI